MKPSRPQDASPSDREIEQGLHASRLLETPPDHVLQRAMAVWRPAPKAGASTVAAVAARVQAGAAALVRRLQAALTHDSGWAAPAALGLRAGAGSTRQMLFSTEGHDIDLRISQATDAVPPAWRISGQVLGPESAGVARLHCGAWQAETAWNELSEFRFAAVPGGACTLVLAGANWEIAIGPIDLPPPPEPALP